MLKVKRLHRFALPPTRKLGSAGYDLYSHTEVVIPSYERVLIPIGLACEFPNNYVARLCDRSGMAAKKGLHVIAGVIDSTYRGEWKIVIYNTTNKEVTLPAQTRVAQVLFYQVADFSVIEVGELSDTERGTGGFGSTGEK